jgi:hypothetical protein
MGRTRTLIALGALAALHATSVNAHMHDRPELDGWFATLKMPDGSTTCCSYIDGTVIAPNEYFILDQAPPSSREKCRPVVNRSTEKPGEPNEYCVFLFDQWWLVPARVVLREPNKYGEALVFGLWGWEGAPQRRTVDFFRCFLPGGGA